MSTPGCSFRSNAPNSGRRDGFASVAFLVVFGIILSSMWRMSSLSHEHLTARTRGTEAAVAALAAVKERSGHADDALRFSVGSRLAAAILAEQIPVQEANPILIKPAPLWSSRLILITHKSLSSTPPMPQV